MSNFSQVSIFALIDEYDTAQLPISERHKDGHAWAIEYRGIGQFENDDVDYVEARCRRVIFKADIRKAPDGFLWEHAETDDGKAYRGWVSAPHELFRTRPTMNDIRVWIHKHNPDYADKPILEWEDLD